MSKRRSNKSVKRMMSDVYDGHWNDYNSKGERWYGNGMRFMQFCGYFNSNNVYCDMCKTISLAASELKEK